MSADGFNGIVAIGWVVVFLTWTLFKSNAGRTSADILGLLRKTARLVI
jgi:hypothetical protein